MSYDTEKTKEEIQAVIDETMDNPEKFHGMSYTDGVRYALEWILGQQENSPMED